MKLRVVILVVLFLFINKEIYASRKNEYKIINNVFAINNYSRSVLKDKNKIDSLFSHNVTPITGIYIAFDAKKPALLKDLDLFFLNWGDYFTKLEKVKIVNYAYKTFPEVFMNFSSINSIDVTSLFTLESFPENVKQLRNLRALDLYKCNITNDGLATLLDNLNAKSLSFLRITSGGHFSIIPSNLCRFANLSYVNFCDNSIISLDSCVYDMPQLKFFLLGKMRRNSVRNFNISDDFISEVEAGFINRGRNNVFVK